MAVVSEMAGDDQWSSGQRVENGNVCKISAAAPLHNRY